MTACSVTHTHHCHASILPDTCLFVFVITILDCVCLQFSSQQGNRGRYTPNYSPAPVQMRPPSMDTSGSQIPSDGILKEIAEKVHRRDWDLLANSLGFLAEDVENYRLENPSSGSQQVGCCGSVYCCT